MNTQTACPDNEAIRTQTAKILLETQSVLFNAAQPFTYTSGRVGPVYIDCRRLISFPQARAALMDMGAALLRRDAEPARLGALAGGETAGIPYAAWLSERLGLPMLYVRKAPKGFGRMAQIEGHFEAGERVLLVEDLQTDGGSKRVFIEALRQAGAVVEHSFVLFHYGIFAASEKNMAALGVRLHSLADWHAVLRTAAAMAYFDVATLREVEKFLADPAGWSVRHGGRGEDGPDTVAANPAADSGKAGRP